jgi:hypothetical protein
LSLPTLVVEKHREIDSDSAAIYRNSSAKALILKSMGLDAGITVNPLRIE